MKKFATILLLTVAAAGCGNKVNAQLSTFKDSSFVFSLLADAETYFAASSYDTALRLCNQAEDYSRKKKYRKGIAYSLIKKAAIYIDKDDLEKAGEFPSRTIELGQQINDSLIIAIGQMQVAQVRMYGNHFNEAVSWFEKCTKNYFSHHSSGYAGLAYNDFGFTLGHLGELQKQAVCFIKALHCYNELKIPDYGEMGATLNNLSALYWELNQRDKAIEYGEQSVRCREKAGDIAQLSLGCCNLSQVYIGVNDSLAKKYQRLCVKYAEQSGDEARIVHSYITSSQTVGSLPEVRAFEKKAIAVLERTKKDPNMLARRYIALGMSFMHPGEDSLQAFSNLSKGLALALQNQDKTTLRDVYLQLCIYQRDRGNFRSAYDYIKKYYLYRDSLVHENTEAAIAEIDTKYQTEKKDNEISSLNAAQKIKELQIEKQNALIAGNLIDSKRKEKEIEWLSQSKELQELRIRRQDEQLEKQSLLATTARQQLQLADAEKQLQLRQLKNSAITRNFILGAVALLLVLAYFLFNRYQLKRKIREQEALLTVRNTIARDLHDEIGSTLTSIRILSEVSGRNLGKDREKAAGFIRKITEQSSAAQQGMSDIVWAIKPENDRLENMVIRMREYVAQTLESKDIAASIEMDEQLLHQTLDMKQRRDFFLVYREAINNIAKYAAATRVKIDIRKNGNGLQLVITDNGQGFDAGALSSSNGLQNMKARAAALHGRLTVQSTPGKGTVVTLQVPTT